MKSLSIMLNKFVILKSDIIRKSKYVAASSEDSVAMHLNLSLIPLILIKQNVLLLSSILLVLVFLLKIRRRNN